MTHRQSNNFYKQGALLALVLVALVVPEVSFAATRRAAAATATKPNFCAAVDAFAEKLKKDMSDNQARFSAKELERQGTLDEKLAKQDADRQNVRFSWDNSRDKVYTELLARASTPAQKAAIKKFRIVVDAAVETRRKSVDAATAAFKDSVEKGIKDRKAAVEAATTLFNNETDQALRDAKADCTSGKAAVDVRAAYVLALQNSQKELQASLAQIKNSDLRSRVVVRQAAIEQAAKDFKAAVTKAEEELKHAFPDA